MWDSANKWRGSVESAEYKHVVLGLIFLKFSNDKFEERRKDLVYDGKEKYVDMVEFYTMKNVFYFQVLQSDVLDEVADIFAELFSDLVKERNSFTELGFNFEEKAFYDILKAIAEKYQFEYPHDKLIVLSREIKIIIDDKAKYTDWSHREDIKAELKVGLILTLAENGYPPVPKDEIFKEIFEQAENFKKYSA